MWTVKTTHSKNLDSIWWCRHIHVVNIQKENDAGKQKEWKALATSSFFPFYFQYPY